ncbi:MAG: HAMP domain-containing sensor histidine kinase [Gaiellaceae bacterium]
MLGTVALLALAVLVALTTAYVLVRRQLIGEVDKALRTRATAVAAIATQLPRATPRRQPSLRLRVPPPPFAEPQGYIQFVSRTGKVRLTPGERIKLPTAGAVDVATHRRQSFFSEATVARKHVRIYTARAGDGAVQVARALGDVDSALSWIKVIFAAISAIAAAATGLLAILVARTALRPVATLTTDVERITATRDLSARTDERRRDELGRLGRAFNSMLHALHESLSAQRQLVADASHELRTPLTTARMSLETIERHPELSMGERQQLTRRAREELEEMTYLIEDLVALARGDVLPSELEPVRLDEIAMDVVAVAARRSGRDLTLNIQPTTVRGASSDLGRAITNLVDNAIKWSPDGTPIDVTVEEGAVSVRDHGAGIAAEDAPHIFDRFYRAASSRTQPGSGLGLAIVKQVAEMHGGTVRARSLDEGGSVFTLELPVVTDAAGC